MTESFHQPAMSASTMINSSTLTTVKSGLPARSQRKFIYPVNDIHIHVVETDEASITFMGGTPLTDLYSSEEEGSDDDGENHVSQNSRLGASSAVSKMDKCPKSVLSSGNDGTSLAPDSNRLSQNISSAQCYSGENQANNIVNDDPSKSTSREDLLNLQVEVTNHISDNEGSMYNSASHLQNTGVRSYFHSFDHHSLQELDEHGNSNKKYEALSEEARFMNDRLVISASDTNTCHVKLKNNVIVPGDNHTCKQEFDDNGTSNSDVVIQLNCSSEEFIECVGDEAIGSTMRSDNNNSGSVLQRTSLDPLPDVKGHSSELDNMTALHSDRLDTLTCDNTQSAKQAEDSASAESQYLNKLCQMHESRFNPFDRDVVFEEDHFNEVSSSASPSRMLDIKDTKQDSFEQQDQQIRQHGLSDPHSYSSASDSLLGNSISSSSPLEFITDDDITFAELGLAEDHFARPEGHFGLSGTEELQMAIEKCKELIQLANPNSEKQKNLIRKLVQLRMKLRDMKEGPDPIEPDIKVVVGHRFHHKDNRSSKYYCEKCNGVIWGMLQVWYKCDNCGYRAHERCLNLITRTCARVKVLDSSLQCILQISPERGLAAQQYRCAECRACISFKSSQSEPRLCDYTGNYYCQLCHWNDTMIIPARLLHNWDFEQRKVCRASKQLLKLMSTRAVIRIQDINPMLFNFVEELNDVKKLREEILIMKKYFLSCKDALNTKLLLQLQKRQHFVENSDMYSVQDLMDVHEDTLLPELAKIHSSFAQHIKTDCQLCQAKGFICELCDSTDVLFPFDNIAIVCGQCSYVLHRHCFNRKGNKCPRCERRDRRNADSSDNIAS